MYSVAALINGKDQDDTFTIYRTYTHPDQMLQAIDAMTRLGAFNISVVKDGKNN